MTGGGALRHYGTPVDMFRQLALLGAAVNLTRDQSVFRIRWRLHVARVPEARTVFEAFEAPADEWWQALCVAVAGALAGVDLLEMVTGSAVEVDLSDALARTSAALLPDGMLDRGLLQ